MNEEEEFVKVVEEAMSIEPDAIRCVGKIKAEDK